MTALRIAACLACALALASAAAQPVPVSVRDIGYTLGDVIDAHAELPLAPGQSVDVTSLPVPGRVSPWLELRAVQLQQGRQLRLQWQAFATVETAQTLYLPAVPLKLKGPGAQTLTVASRPFQMSPVLPTPLSDRQARAAPEPAAFDTAGPASLAALAGGAGALLAVAGLWLADRLPGWPRKPGPFTQLARWMRRHPVRQGRALDHVALRRIHRALSAAAGQTLYPATLPTLFQRAPAAAALRGDIEAFFAASWAQFFDEGGVPIDAATARGWIERLARAERLRR